MPRNLCPACNGSGVLTDDPFVLRCDACGGIYTADQNMPLTLEQSLRFVAWRQPMLPNAGTDGAFYFDLDVTTYQGGGWATTRLHGWADRKTKRVVQWG